MTRTATTFEARYRARGYSPEDEALLREILEEFGAVRLRPLRLPEAGGSFELWLGVSFVGAAMATGLIGHLTGKLYDQLSSGLLRFYRARRQRDGYEPEMSLSISYDDTELEFGPVTENELKQLPELVRRIHDRLHSPPLVGRAVTNVLIGMVREGDYWSEPHLQNIPEDGDRFWGLSFDGHRAVTHILDTETALLAERPIRYDVAPPESEFDV